jgi:hypothetical protein
MAGGAVAKARGVAGLFVCVAPFHIGTANQVIMEFGWNDKILVGIVHQEILLA